jgi:adenosylcobinamide-GDP ribazoletransferase
MQRVPARYLPLVGILIGAIGGAVYWLAAQFWPSSVAVVLSLFAIALLSGNMSEDSFAKLSLLWTDLFVLLVKYNVLMALTAANLGFSVPANVALGLIMVCGQAASRALLVSVLASRTGAAETRANATDHDRSTPPLSPRASATDEGSATQLSPHVSSQDLGVSLVLGFAPATLLGIPGLMGVAAAIIMRLGLAAYLKRGSSPSRMLLNTFQQSTEACFYLGALATWKYI